MKSLFYCLLFLFSYAAFGQTPSHYLELFDASGFEERLKHQVALDTSAKALSDVFINNPAMQNQFKVVTGNFYLHSTAMEGGIAAAFKRLEAETSRRAPYYMLIGKESNEFGVFNKFWVSLKLPQTQYSCLDDSKKAMIEEMASQKMVTIYAEEYDYNPYKYYKVEQAGMEVVKGFLQKYIDCCPPNVRSNPICTCEGIDTLTTALVNRGMLYFDVEDITFIEQDYGNINTDGNILIANNGYTWNLTDELSILATEMNAAKDSIKVRYFDDFSCFFIWDYLNGKEEVPVAAARKQTSDFFHEVIVLKKDGKNRVFFRFSENTKDEVLDKWALKLAAVGKPIGLYYMAANLFFEECFRESEHSQAARNASRMSTANWLKNAYTLPLEDTQIDKVYPSNTDIMIDYLTSTTSQFNQINQSIFLQKTLDDNFVNTLKVAENFSYNTVAYPVGLEVFENSAVIYSKYQVCLGLKDPERIIARNFVYEGNIYYENEDQHNFTCITPTGHLFNLPQGAVAAFNPGRNDLSGFETWPAGCLVGFEIDKEQYVGWWESETQQFLGYAPKSSLGIEQAAYANGSVFKQTNPDKVYAARAIDCEVEILSGRHWPTNFLELRPSPSIVNIGKNATIIENLSITSFEVIQTDRYLTRECIGDKAWCEERYQAVNHPYLNPNDVSNIARVIQENACLLSTLEHHSFDSYPETEFMSALNDIVFYMVGAGLTVPIIAAESLPLMLQELIKKGGKKFTVGVIIDALIQSTIHYYFPANGQAITWDEARAKIDWKQATASGLEAMIDLKSAKADLIVSAAFSCAVDGSLDNGEIRDNFSWSQCGIGILSAVIIQGVLKGTGKALEHLKTLPADQLFTNLKRLGVDYDTGTIYGAGFSNGSFWNYWKGIHGKTPTAEQVKDLLKIDNGTIAQELADAIANNTKLVTDLLESGIFIKIRDAENLTKGERATLLQAFLNTTSKRGQNLLIALKNDFDLLFAWKKAANLISPTSKLAFDVDYLKNIKNILNHPDKALLDKVGGVDAFIKENAFVPCRTCNEANGYDGTTTIAPSGITTVKANFPGLNWMFPMEVVFENTVYAIKNLDGLDDFNNVIKDLRTQSHITLTGMHHMLHHIRIKGWGSHNIEKIDAKFSNTTDTRFDIELKDGITPKWFEYKSYTPDSKLRQLPQFLSYLRNINNFDELNYVFDIRKLTPVQAKEKMQEYMKSNANAIFEEIWTNDNLRKSIWKDLTTPPTPDEKASSYSGFLNMIKNTNLSFFNFVTVN